MEMSSQSHLQYSHLTELFLAAKVKSSQKKTEVGLEYLKQEVEFWMLALWFNETELELLDT